MSFHTLYLCYFGLREPLVQTQVLPYLRELQKDDIKISIMTFEPQFNENWTRRQIEEQRAKFAEENIDWYPLPYHKSPSVPATIYDVLNGARLARKLIREKKIDALHGRSHVATLMGAIAKIASRCPPKLVFDIRGFFPEEYTDAGNWKKNGYIYRAVKIVEKWLMKKADAFVVLTEQAREIIFPESRATGFDKLGRPVEVIPCCVDLERFGTENDLLRNEMRQRLNLNGRRVIIYVGSLGGWYMNNEMFDFFAAAHEQDNSTFIIILTQREAEKAVAQLKEKDFSEKDFLVMSVAPSEIFSYAIAADVALSFIKECYSKKSSSPTKIAEYLASGLPIVSNKGIGDLDELVETEKVGALVENFNRESYLKSLEKIAELQKTGNLARHCKTIAKKRFDLAEIGGDKYRSLYKKLEIKLQLKNFKREIM